MTTLDVKNKAVAAVTQPGRASERTSLNSAGMEEIIHHESKCRQFTARGEPLRSFDNGYGLCQLTNPAPAIEPCYADHLLG